MTRINLNYSNNITKCIRTQLFRTTCILLKIQDDVANFQG